MMVSQLIKPTAPFGVHPDRARLSDGRFTPRIPSHDADGRRLVVLDMREVERRLKARGEEE